MRLTCPSCQSGYEVDAAAIGPKGRMVRCANCGGEWFQAPEGEIAPAPVAEPAAPEQSPRAADAYEGLAGASSAATVEGAVANAGAGAGDRGYRIIEETPSASVTYDEAPEIERSFPAQPVQEDDYMPNRHAEARDTDALTASLHDERDTQPASGGGLSSFIGGFATTGVLVALLSAVYLASTRIVDAVPALEPIMASYVGLVDQGRTVLNVLAGG